MVVFWGTLICILSRNCTQDQVLHGVCWPMGRVPTGRVPHQLIESPFKYLNLFSMFRYGNSLACKRSKWSLYIIHQHFTFQIVAKTNSVNATRNISYCQTWQSSPCYSSPSSSETNWRGLRKQLREFTLNTQQELELERAELLTRNAMLEQECQELNEYIDTHLARYDLYFSLAMILIRGNYD